MPTSFRRCAPDQSLLFPPCPRDWLPEGHLAFFISDTVAALDLKALYAPYEGDGRRNAPFDPCMMVTVLLYAYATGTFSSRRIACKLEEDVAYRMLAAGNFPAHRTIADFRRQHLAAFEGLFAQVVRIAREAGMVRLGTLAIERRGRPSLDAHPLVGLRPEFAWRQRAPALLRARSSCLVKRLQGGCCLPAVPSRDRIVHWFAYRLRTLWRA